MHSEKRRNHEDSCKRYLDEVADAYVQDTFGVIYKPKAEVASQQTGDFRTRFTSQEPLWVILARDWPSLLVSFGTLILLCFTVHYARKQWHEADRNADASEQSAAHALATLGEVRAQTALLQTQVEASMAAILHKQFLITYPDSTTTYISVVLDNRGKSLISNVTGQLQVTSVLMRKKDVVLKVFPFWTFTVPTINASLELPIERSIPLSIPQDYLNGSLGSLKAVKLQGTVSYFNAFHEQQEPICLYIVGSTVLKNKQGVVQQTSGEAFVPCGEKMAHLSYYRKSQELIDARQP